MMINIQEGLTVESPDGIYANPGLLFSDKAIHTVKLAVFV
jgi:hypothetical protein